MKQSRRRSGILSLILGGALTISGCSAADTPNAANDESPITVGVLLPLTGTLAVLGNEMYNGYKVATETINEAGGINGRPIELKVSDAPTPEDAVAVAGELSTDPEVSAIMGSYSSGIAIPASAVADRNQKVYWETGSAAEETTERGLEYLFRTTSVDGSENYKSVNADFLADTVAPALGKDITDVRIGLVYEDGVYGTSGADAFHVMAEANDWNVVADQPYSATANDLSSVVQNLKNADAEVVYAISYVNDAILLTKQSKELGFKPKMTFGLGSGFVTPDFIEAVGEDVNGIVVVGIAPLNITDDILNADLSPTYSEFDENYKEMVGRDPLTTATIGYVGAMTLFQDVLANADPSDSESILEAARAVDIPDGGTVAYHGVKFDETGQNERADWYVMQYQNGVMATVFPTEVAAAEFQLAGE